jgi:hypothetical protein
MIGNLGRLRAGLLPLFVGLLSAAGCGSNGDLGQVKGNVTLDGAPLADATVIFSPVTAGSTSAGKTDANGEYELIYSESVKGADVGPHHVWISTGQPANEDSDPPAPAIPEKVPAKYRTGSALTAEVVPGANTIDFPLDSSASNAQPPPPQLRGDDAGRCGDYPAEDVAE